MTQTGQISFKEVNVNDFLFQTKTVLDYFETQQTYKDPKIEKIHVNFMARGEPLLNRNVNDRLIEVLNKAITIRGLNPTFKVSTIIPVGTKTLQHLNHPKIEIYYSLYSLKESFRKKWLPKAMKPDDAVNLLRAWQSTTNGKIKLHWALIEGENDSQDDAKEIVRWAEDTGLKCSFNLVRYNPANKKSAEPSQNVIDKYVNEMKIGLETKIIPRVGPDVFASCGMFSS